MQNIIVVKAGDLKTGDHIQSDNIDGLIGVKEIITVTLLRWNRVRFKMQHRKGPEQSLKGAFFNFSLSRDQSVDLIQQIVD